MGHSSSETGQSGTPTVRDRAGVSAAGQRHPPSGTGQGRAGHSPSETGQGWTSTVRYGVRHPPSETGQGGTFFVRDRTERDTHRPRQGRGQCRGTEAPTVRDRAGQGWTLTIRDGTGLDIHRPIRGETPTVRDRTERDILRPRQDRAGHPPSETGQGQCHGTERHPPSETGQGSVPRGREASGVRDGIEWDTHRPRGGSTDPMPFLTHRLDGKRLGDRRVFHLVILAL